MMSDINPYASPEEPASYFPHPDGRTGEPMLPLTMSLSHKIGIFSSRPCQLSVTEDRIVISAPHLKEFVAANMRIELRLLDMIVHGDDGRRYRLVYPKNDPEKPLTLARLETWMDPALTNDPEESERRVTGRLVKWSCGMVNNWLIGFLVFQTLVMLILISSFMSRGVDVLDFIYVVAGLMALHTAFLLLRFRQAWTLYPVLLLYGVLCLYSLMSINPFGVLIFGCMIYYTAKALSDYHRLRPRVGGS